MLPFGENYLNEPPEVSETNPKGRELYGTILLLDCSVCLQSHRYFMWYMTGYLSTIIEIENLPGLIYQEATA